MMACNVCDWTGEEPRSTGDDAPDLCPECLTTDIREVQD
jgi:hypothetical protein